MLTVFILILFALALWMTLKPSWLPEPLQTEPITVIAAQTGNAYNRSKSWFSVFKERLPFWRSKHNLVVQYQHWVADTDFENQKTLYTVQAQDITSFRAWLAALSEPEVASFVTRIDNFCRELNAELSWLTKDNVDGNLKQIFEGAVLQYSLAAWRGRQVTTYAAYMRWLSAPYKHQNWLFVERLYPRLVENGFTMIDADLMVAPKAERQARMVEAIERAATQYSSAFLILVEEVLAEDATAAEKKRNQDSEAIGEVSLDSQIILTEVSV